MGLVSLLERVAERRRELSEIDVERARGRERLRAAMRAARGEGLSYAAIGRAAGVTRQRARAMIEGG